LWTAGARGLGCLPEAIDVKDANACRCAGEEGDAQNIWDTINHLKVRRIDHGVHCVDDPALIEHLEGTQLPLTVCPLSNQKVRNELPSTGH